MRTHKGQIGYRRAVLASLVLVIAAATWTPQVAESAEGRRRRIDFQDANVVRNLIYKRVDGRNLQLDIYSPKSITHPLPVVLWIHGHRWSYGSKKQRPPVNFVAQGYIVVCLDYRLSGEAPFPAAIEDCKAAVRWLRANATTYHIDSDHIGAGGHSAGGHLAALLGTSGGVASLEGGGDNLNFSSRIQAVCDLSGPTDILRLYESVAYATGGAGLRAKTSVEQFLGGSGEEIKEKAIAASPITYVSRDDAAFLLIHGENDRSIPVNQSEVFVSKLKAAGVDATLETAQGRGHSVGGPNFAGEIISFFDTHLKPNGSG